MNLLCHYSKPISSIIAHELGFIPACTILLLMWEKRGLVYSSPFFPRSQFSQRDQAPNISLRSSFIILRFKNPYAYLDLFLLNWDDTATESSSLLIKESPPCLSSFPLPRLSWKYWIPSRYSRVWLRSPLICHHSFVCWLASHESTGMSHTSDSYING